MAFCLIPAYSSSAILKSIQSPLFDENASNEHIDRSALEIGLIGYEAERQKIEAAIATIRNRSMGHAETPAVNGARKPRRRRVAGWVIAVGADHRRI